MLLAEQLAARPDDMTDEEYRSHLAAVTRMHRTREAEIRYRRALTLKVADEASRRRGP